MTTKRDKEISEAVDMHQMLIEEAKETQIFKDYSLRKASAIVLGNFLHWQKTSKQDTERSKQFKQGIEILTDLLKRTTELMDKAGAAENKATYYQMQYDSVRSTEAVQEKINQNLIRLYDENQKLKDQIKELRQKS